MDIKSLRDSFVRKVDEKSPEILVGLGLAGMLTSTMLAVKATPKALNIIEHEENYRGEEIGKLDKVKLTWKCYVPSAIGYCASAACIIGAQSVNGKRNVVLASAYKVSEAAMLEYRNKVVETLGEEKEKEIRESINRDRVERDFNDNKVVVVGKDGNLCYDSLSGRYFKSDINKIEKVVNEANYRLMNENILSLNEFYNELGLANTELGYEKGWDVIDGLIDISFDSIITEDGQPCIVLEFNNPPKYGYEKFC